MRSVGLNETSYTAKASPCLLRNLLHCKDKDVSTLHILFPLIFFVFNQSVSHLTPEVNVEQVFSWVGQRSEINVDPDSSLTDMTSIMINKHTYKPCVKDIMDKYYDMFVTRIEETKQTFSTVPRILKTRTQMVNWT